MQRLLAGQTKLEAELADKIRVNEMLRRRCAEFEERLKGQVDSREGEGDLREKGKEECRKESR